MKYYIYLNWKDKPHIGVLHVNSCPDCDDGKGKSKSKKEGLNGVWVGAFDEKKLAQDFANRIGISLHACTRCPK